MTSLPPIVSALLALVGVGAGWLAFYWRVLDPALRRLLGKCLGVQVQCDGQNIWRVTPPLHSAGDNRRGYGAHPPTDGQLWWRSLICRGVQRALLGCAIVSVFPLTALLVDLFT